MTTKHYTEDMLQVSESVDNNMVAVSVPNTVAGSADITLFICGSLRADEPFLRGEDYPVLVQVWDNKEDDIYDTL